MSDCIHINNTEHLPQENTLLINYTIVCSGTWDILQNDTAYRNVCDSYWTIMYPNIQHPRHTDFPISVGSNPISCTFAWNYGGIQGIGSENFDANHSYLVQLGIYNTTCSGISQTGSGGRGNNNGPVYTPTGPVLNDPQPPIPPRPRPPLPPTGPLPPRPIAHYQPTSPVPTDPGVSVPGGSGGSTTTVPVGSAFPEIIPGHYDPGSGVVQQTQTTPVGTTPGYIPPRNYQIPVLPTNVEGSYNGPIIVGTSTNTTSPINPYNGENGPTTTNLPVLTYNVVSNGGSIGGSSSNGTVGTNHNFVYVQQIPTVTNLSNQVYQQDPNGNNSTIVIPGLPLPNIVVGNQTDPYGTQVGLPSISTNQDIDSNNPSIDVGLNVYSNINDSEGNLSRLAYDSVPVNDQSSSYSLKYFDTSSINPIGKAIIKLSSDEITQGEKLFISSMYKVQDNIDLVGHMQLWLIDSQGRNILLGRTEEGNLNIATIAFNINTYQSPTGPNTILLLVKDSSNRTIGIASRKFVIRPIIALTTTDQRNLVKESSDKIYYNRLPAIINNYLSLGKDYEEIIIGKTNQITLIYTKISSPDTFSAIAVCNSNADFSITVKSGSQFGRSTDIKNSQIFDSSIIGFSDKRLKLDGEEVIPASHNVGIANIPTSEDTLLINVAQRNSILKDNTKVRLYVSSNYILRPITTSTTFIELPLPEFPTPPSYLHSIVFTTPYANTKVGFIVHGNREGYIPEDYTITIANTDETGSVTWTNSGLYFGDYFSLIISVNGVLNPYKGIVYTSKL